MYTTGLNHFADFLKIKHGNQAPDTIIPSLTDGKINVYELLDEFVSYLSQRQGISVSSLRSYIAAVKSYLEFYDIDIVPSKFRRRVKMPKFYADPEDPLSLTDIRELLEFCSNARLRCYLLVLVSSALRPIDAASLRLCDADFSILPTRITVRREYSKTKRSRQVYLSEEATRR